MIEFGDTPVKVRVAPSSLAPREFMTISDGSISALAGPAVFPMVFIAGELIASSAKASAGGRSRPGKRTARQATRLFDMNLSFPVLELFG
jgi:hypothetical protein